MPAIWELVSRTAIAGTDRNPLPESILEALGIQASGDATQKALLALPAAKLLHQAARLLAPEPERQPEPCPSDERPLCPSRAALPLQAMLAAGTFPDALPEFFACLDQGGCRLPPEWIPMVLDWAVRKQELPVLLERALGPAGPWLAGQHPDWQMLYGSAPASWETGSFAERQRLFREARRNRPLVGLAWVEKTWMQERAEHRFQFLELLRTGLSRADESLLEQAVSDKSRRVRMLAYRLLLLLPDSQLRQTVRAWLESCRQQLTKAKNLPRALASLLPPEGPFSKMQLLSLDPEKSGDVQLVLLQLIPPDDLARAMENTPDELLAKLVPEKNANEATTEAWLKQIAWCVDMAWLQAAARYFSERPGHPGWQSGALATVLNALPESDWQACMNVLASHPQLLETENSALVRALSVATHPWPGKLVQTLLLYPLRSRQPRHWTPPRHFQTLLYQAAYHCNPEDTEALQQSTYDWPYAWHSELMQFRAVVEFRRHMRRAFVTSG